MVPGGPHGRAIRQTAKPVPERAVHRNRHTASHSSVYLSICLAPEPVAGGALLPISQSCCCNSGFAVLLRTLAATTPTWKTTTMAITAATKTAAMMLVVTTPTLVAIKTRRHGVVWQGAMWADHTCMTEPYRPVLSGVCELGSVLGAHGETDRRER
jgi:hypothetical protein